MILVPSLYHSDRKVPTCYRTWRRRGWCLLELYAAAMSRDTSNPPLLVRSERGTPTWISHLEVQKLSIGLADFTCCQRNHVITTETQKIMSGGKVKKISCDKPIAGGILEQLINAKINHLFNMEEDIVKVRWYSVLKHWWMRGLNGYDKIQADKNKSATQKFKVIMRWDQSEKWFDRKGVGVLMYAVVGNEVNVVRELLEYLQRHHKDKEYNRRLASRVRDEGYVTVAIPGRITTLMAAMMLACPDVVSTLLEYGACVDSVDVMGNDALMLSSVLGQFKNIRFWTENVKGWDLSKNNTILGGTALSCALYLGPSKFETVNVLLNGGARLDYRSFIGHTVLTTTSANEDSNPNVLRLIIEKLKENNLLVHHINCQQRATTLKWKTIYFVAKTLYRAGVSRARLMGSIALWPGITPLGLAVIRGDVEIVKILLENGADPYVENDLGMNAFDICKKCGPFPSVIRAMRKHLVDKATHN